MIPPPAFPAVLKRQELKEFEECGAGGSKGGTLRKQVVG